MASVRPNAAVNVLTGGRRYPSMPTQSTYATPGYQARSGQGSWFQMSLMVHTQMTRGALIRACTCRHAARNSLGLAWPHPHEYQTPFISCPKDKNTGLFSERIAAS